MGSVHDRAKKEGGAMDLFSGLQESSVGGWEGRAASAWDLSGDGRGVVLMAHQCSGWADRQAPRLEPRRVSLALQKDATARRVLLKGAAPAVGERVGVRLNLNILSSQGVCVHSVHKGGSASKPMKGGGYWNGEVLDYREVVTLRSAWFSVHQAGRQAIAAGEVAKHPMASIDGVLCEPDTNISGVEARFNPKTTHLFLDMQKYAVRWAEEVTVIGHRAYARGLIVYHTRETAPVLEKGCAASEARFR